MDPWNVYMYVCMYVCMYVACVGRGEIQSLFGQEISQEDDTWEALE
jgi:hypothetical protein